MLVKCISAKSEGGATLLAGEAATVEELALGADPFQHIDPLAAEVTLLIVY